MLSAAFHKQMLVASQVVVAVATHRSPVCLHWVHSRALQVSVLCRLQLRQGVEEAVQEDIQLWPTSADFDLCPEHCRAETVLRRPWSLPSNILQHSGVWRWQSNPGSSIWR